MTRDNGSLPVVRQANIAEESPYSDGVAALIAGSDAFAASLYPPESNHAIDVDTLAKPNVRFFVARIDGMAVGCAGIARYEGWSEVKRLFVSDAARGQRLGERLLATLEAAARSDAGTCLRLETGIHNAAALKLYRGVGFVEIDRFGQYPEDPLSVYMEKRLS